MKIHAINILSQLCLNHHNGEDLSTQMLVTENDEFGLIAHISMVFDNYNQILSKPNETSMAE